MKEKAKALIDLTRAHFMVLWPLFFCSGLFLAFNEYGEFSFEITIKAALIGLMGFEAAMILNDYIDYEYDKKDVEFDRLTAYWRPFKKRPLIEGTISKKFALALAICLLLIVVILIYTLPAPNRWYLYILVICSFGAEFFYQIKKRRQNYPIAQLIGRIDLSLFPIAGYMIYGRPDMNIILIFIFIYTYAQAHLALNDLIDFRNDLARGMNTIVTMYGRDGALRWIRYFTFAHFLIGILFIRMLELDIKMAFGILTGFILLAIGIFLLSKDEEDDNSMRVLPIYHAAIGIYVMSIIIGFLT